MILSIIIPVYNVEKYIEKCLLSCMNQDISLNKYEIIVVNDGSLDNSRNLIQGIKDRYDNISIIDQENKGLSEARNTGFKKAKGKYVWFVDSDDWIEMNCLGRICGYLKDDLDILQLPYRLVYENTGVTKEILVYRIEEIKSGPEVVLHGDFPAPVQFSIFRSQFLQDNNLSFVPGIVQEDLEFKPRATYLANKITSDTVVCYNYLQRTSGSITSSFKLKNGLDIIFVLNSLLRFTEVQNIPFVYRRSFYRLMGLNMNTLLSGLFKLDDVERRILVDELYKNKSLFRYILFSSKLKYQIEGLFFTINFKFGLNMYKLFK